MRFGAPELIWAAPLGVAGIWYLARRGRWTVGRRRRRWVLALRMVGVGLALLALAQPMLSLPQRQRAVLLTLDRSLSMGSESRMHQEQLVAQAVAHAGTDDLVGLMVFGSEARMDTALTTGRELLPVRSVVDGSASDLASALRAAAALLPTAGARRVVLMSDMSATGGGVREVAEELAEAGVAVDVVVLESALDAEALVEWVEVPGLVREGELLSATVRVRSSFAGPAQLRITAGDLCGPAGNPRCRPAPTDVDVLVPVNEALPPTDEEDGKSGRAAGRGSTALCGLGRVPREQPGGRDHPGGGPSQGGRGGGPHPPG